jgi:hypothetical protein
MSSKNQDSIWSNRITTIGFSIIIIGILINIIFHIIKYFDIDVSSVVVYISFFVFMVICFFVLPKDIPMGLVLSKNPIPIPSAPDLLPSAPPKIM